MMKPTKKYLDFFARRQIAMDEPAARFLDSLGHRLAHLKLQPGKFLSLASILGCKPTTLEGYRYHQSTPRLREFIMLAEYFKVDISDSINYKVYRGQFSFRDLRERARKAGLSFTALSVITGYDFTNINRTFYPFGKNGQCYRRNAGYSMNCLNSILTAIEREEIEIEDAAGIDTWKSTN